MSRRSPQTASSPSCAHGPAISSPNNGSAPSRRERRGARTPSGSVDDPAGVRGHILPLHHALAACGGLDGRLSPHGLCLRRGGCRHRRARDPARRMPLRRGSGDAAHAARTGSLAISREDATGRPRIVQAISRSARTLERPSAGALAGISGASPPRRTRRYLSRNRRRRPSTMAITAGAGRTATAAP